MAVGKGKIMLVRTILEEKNRPLVTAKATHTIEEAMELLISNGIGCLPIVDDQAKLVGVVSDKDIFKRIHLSKTEFRSIPLSEIMTTELVVGVPDDDLHYVAKIMDKNWIRHLPIVQADELIGLVSQRDIIKTQTENIQAENRYLKLYTNGLGSRDKSSDY